MADADPRSLQQIKRENESDTPRLEVGHENVLNRNICDGDGNQRLHDFWRNGDDAVDT